MSIKPCVAKGHRECIRGFHRDLCTKCDMGARSCNMCSHTKGHAQNIPRIHISHSTPSSPRSSFDDTLHNQNDRHNRRASSLPAILSSSAPSASSPCIFCYEGQRECDECFGVGFVQRVCRDCIREHYRRQEEESKSRSALKKAKHQIYETRQQFSRSLVSLTSTSRPSSPLLSPSSSTLKVQEQQQQQEQRQEQRQERQERRSSRSDDDHSMSDCSIDEPMSGQSKRKSVGSSLRQWAKMPVKTNQSSKSTLGTRKWASICL